MTQPMRSAVIIAALLLGVPTIALACRGPGYETGILHDAVPALTPDQVAVEVQITSQAQKGTVPVIEARIIRMLQGRYQGSRVLISPAYRSSCDRFEGFGVRGIVVGRPTQSSSGALVIDPIRAPPQDQWNIR